MIALVPLAACRAAPSVVSHVGDDLCGASRLAGLAGQRRDAARLPDHPELRVIGQDTVVTMDFRPDRLNVSVGRDGIIFRVACRETGSVTD